MTLSPAEQRIVNELATGASNKQIAEKCGYHSKNGDQVVKNVLSRIYRKLGLENRVQLANWLRDNNL